MAEPTTRPANDHLVTGPWRKSSFTDDHCVELAPAGDDHIAMRNSNDHTQGILILPRTQMAALIADMKAGTLDDLL